MDTVLKFDKFVLTSELSDKFKKIGEIFEIAFIREDSFLLRDAKTKVAVGVVSFDDLEKHFVKEEEFQGWTQWESIVGFDGQSDILYKTNRRKVVVKFLNDKVRAESCCHKADDFNLVFGIHLAYLRCLNKALEKKKDEYEKTLKKINIEIIDNSKIVENMINSLE